jgi:hypothetical protein
MLRDILVVCQGSTLLEVAVDMHEVVISSTVLLWTLCHDFEFGKNRCELGPSCTRLAPGLRRKRDGKSV